MTDREKAIVMAHTGICMLTGDKFQIFHKYVEDIMGRPVWTHEMSLDSIADEIKAKSKDDFIALCADESKFDVEDYTSKLEAYTDGWNDGRQDLIHAAEDGSLEKRLGNLVKDKKKLLEALEEIQAICEDITY